MLAPKVIPTEGLSHPALRTLASDEDFRVRFYYANRLDDEVFARIDGIVDRWLERKEWSQWGGEPRVEEATDSRWTFVLRFAGVPAPAAPLEAFAAMLKSAGVSLQEVFLAKWKHNARDGVWSPVNAEGRLSNGTLQYASEDHFLDALFSARTQTPAAEDPLQLKGAKLTEQEQLALEVRGLEVHAPGIRVAWGLCESYATIAGDDRTAQIERTLTQQLAIAWKDCFNYGQSTPALVPWNFERRAGAVDTIIAHGRRGYELFWFAHQLQLDEGKSFRQREYEAIQALAATIRALGLAPVLNWIRVGKPLPGGVPMGPLKEPFKYYFQLWEPASYAVPNCPPRTLAPWPPSSVDEWYRAWLDGEVRGAHQRRHPKNDRQRLQSILGATFGDELRALLTVREHDSLNGRVLGPLELDDYTIDLPTDNDEELFSALLHSPSHAGLLHAFFCDAVPLGYLRNSQAECWIDAHTNEENKNAVYALDPQQGLTPLADGAAALLTWCAGLDREQTLSPKKYQQLFDQRLVPSLECESFAGEPFVPSDELASREERAFPFVVLLGLVPVPDDLIEIVDAMSAQGTSLHRTLDETLADASFSHTPSSGLYVLCSQFFLDAPTLDRALTEGARATSPLVRSAAAFFARLQTERKEDPLLQRRTQIVDLMQQHHPELLAQRRR